MKTLMAAAVGVGLAAAAAGARAASSPAEGPAPAPAAPGGPYDDLYRKYGAQFGIDWRLVKAHAMVENKPQDPQAVNYEDDESIGLMQVLCKPDGRGGCANKFNVQGWKQTTRQKLFDPDWNVYIAAQILAWNIKKYGWPKGSAVYNAWDQHTAPAAGPFKNQSYVNAVQRAAAKLGLVI